MWSRCTGSRSHGSIPRTSARLPAAEGSALAYGARCAIPRHVLQNRGHQDQEGLSTVFRAGGHLLLSKRAKREGRRYSGELANSGHRLDNRSMRKTRSASSLSRWICDWTQSLLLDSLFPDGLIVRVRAFLDSAIVAECSRRIR